MNKPQFVYVTYISTTPEKLWKALTDPEMTGQYWGHSNVSDWKPGSSWQHQRTDGTQIPDVVGRVIESDPPRRLVFTWAYPEHEDQSKYSGVTFDIEPVEDVVRLTVTHMDLQPGEVEDISEGWPKVLSNLKSFLELGQPLLQLS